MNDASDAMCRTGEPVLACDVEAKLRRMSASAIDRLLACERKELCLKGRATTKPGSLLKSNVPIRSFIIMQSDLREEGREGIPFKYLYF
ncbi:MAG: hypothetical protein LBL86_05600, partial [Coriobacteriales bacterium]|jgi:hypothetical protein|nr:hypothetical protein [Coriobacteriales bacterium]